MFNFLRRLKTLRRYPKKVRGKIFLAHKKKFFQTQKAKAEDLWLKKLDVFRTLLSNDIEELKNKAAKDGLCAFNLKHCRCNHNVSKNSYYCEVHEDLKCAFCNKQAVTICGIANSWVCEIPLCITHAHTCKRCGHEKLSDIWSIQKNL